ncbi:hypothetical protein RCL1_001285 [Eukaryota sp. TZLM3-RCL]
MFKKKNVQEKAPSRELTCVDVPHETVSVDIETSEGAKEDQQILIEPVVKTTVTRQRFERITREDRPLTHEEAQEFAEIQREEPKFHPAGYTNKILTEQEKRPK